MEGGYNLPEGTLVKPAGEKKDAKEEEEAKPAALKTEAPAEAAK